VTGIKIEVTRGVVAIRIGGAKRVGAGGGARRAIATLDAEDDVALLTDVKAKTLDVEDADLGVVVLRAGRGALLVDLEGAIVGLGDGHARKSHDDQGERGK
jgi:hypothetical protein